MCLSRITALAPLLVALSGQHNFPNNHSQSSDQVAEIVGAYPVIWGSDFGFTDGEDKDSILHRDLVIEEAEKQAAAESIITLCWRVLRPIEDEPGAAGENGRPSPSWRGSESKVAGRSNAFAAKISILKGIRCRSQDAI